MPRIFAPLEYIAISCYNQYMQQRRYPLTEALTHNADVLHHVMYGGEHATFAQTPRIPLPVAILQPGRQTNTAAEIQRFQTLGPREDAVIDMRIFQPRLNFRLAPPDSQPHAKSFSVNIFYAGFALSPELLVGGNALPYIPQLLVPVDFSIGPSDHFDEPAEQEVLAQGKLRSQAEQGIHVAQAAELVHQTAAAIRAIGTQAIVGQMFESL
jgi:hypothetical protein